MTTTTRWRPTDLERKQAATAPAPTAGAFDLSGEPEGTMWAIVAVTGVRDEVGDVVVPGAFRRTLRERPDVKGVCAHDWSRPCARVLSAVELPPGDPRLPAAAVDGSPWPRKAGALLVKARYILGTRDGRDAYEHARAYGGTHAYSIGYKVAANGAQQRGDTRYIADLDLFEFSPVLHGANRLARLLSVKSLDGALRSAADRREADRGMADRGGPPLAVACGVCGRPAAAMLPGGLAPGQSLVCGRCLAEARGERVPDDEPLETISADDLDELAGVMGGVTAEEEFERAIDDEQRYELEADGELHPVDEEAAPERVGRAWTRRDPASGWGTP